MSINVADNFSYLGGKPLDARVKYDTVANMVAVPAANLYDGCLAYVTATKKNYQYDSSNTVDETLGKWREFSSGGGGGTSDYSDLTNKPQVNSVELSGNKSLSDLGITKSGLGLGSVVNTGDSDTPTSGGTTKFTTGGAYTLKQNIDKAYKTDDTAETGLADADKFPFYDSSASAKRSSTWSNIKSVLKTYFDTLYNKYTLPTATSSVLGGIKVGGGLSISDGVLSTNTTFGFTPIGTIISVMGVNAPTNYLKCDGTVYNIANYPELANYFYQQFGSKNYFGGNGTTTFAVPNLNGQFLRGTGTNVDTSQGSGSNVGTRQKATTIPRVQYYAGNSPKQGNIAIGYGDGLSHTPNYTDSTGGTGKSTGTQWATCADSNTGQVSYEYTTRPTNTSVLYCIATKDIYLNPANDYSTTEKVVGTWINGEALYQKTINFGTLPNATTKSVTTGASNIDRVIDIQSYCYAASLNTTILNDVESNNYSRIKFIKSTNVIEITTNSDRSSWSAYITIRYTKT